ncbi:MAG TPA: c-type cytochrome domain-containing protein, partial [Mucilaginibacter sp.]|nr:c-type cytochrome domain-containing protein [Mucilaginibacter sp.]
MRQHLYLLLILCAVCFSCMFYACNQPSNIDEQMPDVVSYNFNIRPILSDKCYKCHGPDASKRQAGLRLDMPESAFKALKDDPNAHVLVPGNPEMSELFGGYLP